MSTGRAPSERMSVYDLAELAFENHVGAVRIAVAPPWGSVPAELAALARDMRRSKRLVTGSSRWLTAQVFRVLGALGRVPRAVPPATLVGNVTTVVAALSCGGRLVVTVMCAPKSAASANALTADLGAGLATVAGLSGPRLVRPGTGPKPLSGPGARSQDRWMCNDDRGGH